MGKAGRILRTVFSLSITRGGISQSLDRVAKALTPTYEALVEQVQSAPVVTPDETGWKIGGHLGWYGHADVLVEIGQESLGLRAEMDVGGPDGIARLSAAGDVLEFVCGNAGSGPGGRGSGGDVG